MDIFSKDYEILHLSSICHHKSKVHAHVFNKNNDKLLSVIIMMMMTMMMIIIIILLKSLP